MVILRTEVEVNPPAFILDLITQFDDALEGVEAFVSHDEAGWHIYIREGASINVSDEMMSRIQRPDEH